jgi:hypothetical protein
MSEVIFSAPPAGGSLRWRFLNSLEFFGRLGHFLGHPVAEVQIFPDFPAFVPVFLIFLG